MRDSASQLVVLECCLVVPHDIAEPIDLLALGEQRCQIDAHQEGLAFDEEYGVARPGACPAVRVVLRGLRQLGAIEAKQPDDRGRHLVAAEVVHLVFVIRDMVVDCCDVVSSLLLIFVTRGGLVRSDHRFRSRF